MGTCRVSLTRSFRIGSQQVPIYSMETLVVENPYILSKTIAYFLIFTQVFKTLLNEQYFNCFRRRV